MAIVVAAIGTSRMQGVQTDANAIPTARVAQGDVPVVVHATGDLRPLKAQALVAPAVGGPMQILTIAATGTPVKEGDVIVEFDQSEQDERLDTAQVGACAGGSGNREDARRRDRAGRAG